jgi:MFS family permease
MADSSTWSALRNPVFRNLWIASLVSGTCVAAHDTAATWAMSSMTRTPIFLSLMSTVASLPFFLFTLPAGALADMVDRRRLICTMNVWLAIAAGGLAVCGWLHLLTPAVILIGVFLVGTGFAWNSPAWTAIQPEIVTNDQLPSAATLGGLQLNISGIIGPLIGGFLLRFLDPSGVFAVNAVCFFLLIYAVLQVKPAKVTSNLPLENFFGSFLTAVRYVRYTQGIQVVLLRNILFAFLISVIPSLLPVVGLKKLHLDPSGLGMIFTFMGIGSVAAAVFVLPWMRARFHSNIITVVANALVAAVFFLMAFSDVEWMFLIAACLAGVAWTMAASELWVAGQRAMPVWARGRMNATIIMAAQGATALGGIVWGGAASMWGVTSTLYASALLAFVGLAVIFILSIDFTGELDFEPAQVGANSLRLIHVPGPRDGPIAIMFDVEVDRARGRHLPDVLREVRLIYLRNGAFSWRLYEDLGRPNTYRVEMMYPSWTEYLLLQERLTQKEVETMRQARALHIGEEPPEVRRFLCVNRDLHTRRMPVTRPSSMPEAPLMIDKASP